MNSKLRIIVTGLIAQHPSMGGVAWDYVQYVVGLAQLGHDVYYFEDSGEWPYLLIPGASGEDLIARDPSANVAHLASVFSQFNLQDRWAYRFPIEDRWYGLSDQNRREVMDTADVLINVSGSLEDPEKYRKVKRLAYIDSDPVFTQIRLALGEPKLLKRVDAHDVHFTFGEHPSDRVPRTGHAWLPTRTPIVTSLWHPSTPTRNAYTTVMSWTSYQPLQYQGDSYAQKDVELLRFVDLPRRVTSANLEVALGQTQHVEWQTEASEMPLAVHEWLREREAFQPSELLAHMGWQVVNADKVCCSLDSYRRYIESSRAEWSIAKHGYVAGQSGWFSCRTACYLAAGRPAVVQDTGFTSVIPTGAGLLAFRTMEETIAAIDDIEANYAKHSLAARAVAESFFGSDKILTRLIDDTCSIKPTVK